MNRRTLLVIALIALLVIITTWLSQTSDKPALTPEQAAAPVSDYFIRGIDATITAANGLPSHHLTADALTHYVENSVTELARPHLILFRPEQEQWTVEAEQGLMEGESDQLTLRGKVLLAQQSRTRPLQVKTDELHLYPDTKYGETDTPVTITSPSSEVSGVGMRVYGMEGRLQLLSDVRGSYETTVR